MATIDTKNLLNDNLLADVLNIATSDLSKDERVSKVSSVLGPFIKFKIKSNREVRIGKDGRAYLVLKTAVKKRLSAEIERVIDGIDLDNVEDLSLLGANEDVLLEFLRLKLLESEIPSSKKSLLKGAVKRMEMLEDSGGLYSSIDVAKLLGFKRQSVVDKLKRHELLGVLIGGSYSFPAFQFEKHNIIPGLSNVIKVLSHNDDMFWDACLFLLNPHDALLNDAKENITPLEAIKGGQSEFVAKLAASRMEQTAN